MDISIIVCTYNPEREVFNRCLHAITKLIIPKGVNIEALIVDNNSTQPVANLDYVKEVTEKYEWFSVITEQKQGVAFARVTAIKKTTYPIVIFFDDDNEPAENYLIQVCDLMIFYPNVAIWGAGNITVEFIAKTPKWVTKWKHVFQERLLQENTIGMERQWQAYYPLGTGQVIRREMLNIYAELFESGQLSCKSRTGKSLTSGEDVQIVFIAVKSGYQVGSSPTLHINHITPPRKATFAYIKRLHFGTAASYQNALIEVYPEEIKKIKLINYKWFYKKVIFYLRHKLHKWGYRKTVFELANYTGEVAGIYYAYKKEEPKWLSAFINLMKFR